jgi:hypothetical protein
MAEGYFGSKGAIQIPEGEVAPGIRLKVLWTKV